MTLNGLETTFISSGQWLQTLTCGRGSESLSIPHNNQWKVWDIPLAIFSKTFVEARDNEDAKRMVREYDPDQEFVAVLIKPGD